MRMRGRERLILTILVAGVVAALPIIEAGAACHVASFVGDPYEVSEGAGKVTITVSNNGGAGNGSIDYETQDATAKSGQDYNARQGTLEFQAPTGVLSFDVTIMNDTKNEKNETFRVRLSNPQGCFSTIQEDTAIVTIQDNDKLITLPTATQTPTPTPTPKKTTPKPKPSTASATPSPSPTVTTPSPSVSSSPIAAAADADGGGLSGGAVGGIVAATLVVGTAAAFWVRRRFLA
jgi:hypothetical protein